MFKENEINITSQYLKEARSFGDLLTADQEIDLGNRIQGGLSLVDKEFPISAENVILTPEAKMAANEFVCRNLGLVIGIAKRITRAPFLDVVQYGNKGLEKAVLKFDPKRGCRFSTNATRWIKQSIFEGIAENERTITLPIKKNFALNKIRKAESVLTNTYKRNPTVAELSAETGFSEKKLKFMFTLPLETLELDSPQKDVKNSVYGDSIEAEKIDFEGRILESQLKTELFAALNYLIENERDRNIILLKFGLIDGEIHTMQEIGLKAGITRERVRQIESDVLCKIRRSPYWKDRLSEYL